jgi:hypothetical protein
MGTEMAMTLPQRMKAIERVNTTAYARGPACPLAGAVHAAIAIIRS